MSTSIAIKMGVSMYMWIFTITAVYMLEVSSDPNFQNCPNKLKNWCKCERTKEAISIVCAGNSLPAIVDKLPSNTESFTYLSEEDDVQLGRAKFNHLTKLQLLHITPADKNAFRSTIFLMPNESKVFVPLEKLRVLIINVAWEFRSPLPKIFEPLVNLEELDLSNTRKIDMNHLIKSFHGFQNNSKLSTLDLWHIQTMGNAASYELDMSQLLEPLHHCPLRRINIGYNALQYIRPGLIRYAPNLTHFFATNNELVHVFKANGFMDIILHPSIKTVSFRYQGYGFLRRLTYNDLYGKWKNPNKTHIRSISIGKDTNTHINDRHNSEVLVSNTLKLTGSEAFDDLSIALDTCMKAVGAINSRSMCDVFHDDCGALRSILQKNHTRMCDLLYLFVPSMFKGIPCHAIPPFQEIIQPEEKCAGCFVIPTTGSLQEADFDHLNIYDELYMYPEFVNNTKCFHKNNSLRSLDLSHNKDRGFPETALTMEMDFSGLDRIEHLNLCQIGLTSINSNLGRNVPNLVSLDLSDNSICLQNCKSDSVFNGLNHLKKLNLAFNKIDKVPHKTFLGLESIEFLNLSHNAIQVPNFSLSSLSNLRYLDLSNNLITKLPLSFTDELDSIAWHTKEDNISLDISNNDIVCNCQNKDFIEWALNTKNGNKKILFIHDDKTLCINKDSVRVQFSNVKLSDIERECRGEIFYIAITVGVTVPVSFLLFGSIAYAYRKRWWFRYQLFLGQQLWRSYKNQESFHVAYQYDVFVSYNQRDQDWIHDVLRPKLEDEHGLKLCLHLRDFMFGSNITEQIISSIENSRHTLLILSPNFLKSSWCQFEMQMAQNKLFATGKDVLLLALLKPLPKVGVSKILKTLMEQKTYIEWSEDDYGQKLFWGKLLQAIKAPREEPFDLDYPEIQVRKQQVLDEETPLLQD